MREGWRNMGDKGFRMKARKKHKIVRGGKTRGINELTNSVCVGQLICTFNTYTLS